MGARVPSPAYPAKDSEILYGDKELYARIAEVADGEVGKKLMERLEIPVRSGKAWVVKKGRYLLNLDFLCSPVWIRNSSLFRKTVRLSEKHMVISSLIAGSRYLSIYLFWGTALRI